MPRKDSRMSSDNESTLSGSNSPPSRGLESLHFESTGSSSSLLNVDELTLSVPFAVLFFSSEGVIVQYCVRVATPRSCLQIVKRFSEVQQLNETLNGSRWWNLITPGGSKLALPKLTTATVGKTNNSIKLVAKRRAELNAYFEALTSLCHSEGPKRREEFAKALMPFLHSTSVGHTALLPEAYRAAASGDGLVFAYLRAPAEVRVPLRSVSPTATSRDVSPHRVLESGRPASRPRTPETRAKTPEIRSREPSTVSHGVDSAVESPVAADGLGLMPRITVALPRSVLYLDDANQLCVALSCEKSEKRQETLNRYRELVAFYRYIATSGDRIPTPDEARTFFLDRQRPPATKRASAHRNRSKLRAADARSTPPPSMHDESSAMSDTSSHHARGGSSGATPREALLPVQGQNPIASGVSNFVPRGRGHSIAARVAVVRSAREVGGSMHLVANTDDPTTGDFAPCMNCGCSDRLLCTAGTSGDFTTPRTSRYIMANSHLLDVMPPAAQRPPE
jgi:hypothetical protein